MNALIKTKKYCQAYSKRDERYWERGSTVHDFWDGLKLSSVCAKKCTADLKNSCFEIGVLVLTKELFSYFHQKDDHFADIFL